MTTANKTMPLPEWREIVEIHPKSAYSSNPHSYILAGNYADCEMHKRSGPAREFMQHYAIHWKPNRGLIFCSMADAHHIGIVLNALCPDLGLRTPHKLGPAGNQWRYTPFAKIFKLPEIYKRLTRAQFIAHRARILLGATVAEIMAEIPPI